MPRNQFYQDDFGALWRVTKGVSYYRRFDGWTQSLAQKPIWTEVRSEPVQTSKWRLVSEDRAIAMMENYISTA